MSSYGMGSRCEPDASRQGTGRGWRDGENGAYVQRRYDEETVEAIGLFLFGLLVDVVLVPLVQRELLVCVGGRLKNDLLVVESVRGYGK